MAGFDEAKFRAAAKAAGYSDDEINAELKGTAAPAPAAPAGSSPPIGMDAAPAIEEKFDKDFEEKRAALIRDQKAKEQEITTTSPFTLPGLLSSPTAAIVTGAGLLTAGYAAGRYGPELAEKAKGAYKGIKERYMTKAPEIDRTIDIPTGGFFDVPLNPNVPPADQPAVQAMDKLQRAEQLAEANRQLGIGGNQPVAPGPIVRGQLPENNPLFSSSPKAPAPPVQPPMTPFTPEELAAVFRGESVGAPISAAPAGAPAPTPSASPGSSATTAVVDELKDMIQQTPDPVTGAVAQPLQPVAPSQELRTGTGKPAFAGMGQPAPLNKKGQPKFKNEYASIADVPAGYAFVPGAQLIDTLRQNIGQAPYTEFFTKRDFPLTNESAIEQSKEINRLLGRATRAEMVAAGLPPAEITRGITQPINQPKGSGMGTKTTRVAGTLGALVAIPEIAKAQTSSERAMAGANLLEAVLPPGFAMSGAGEGSTLSPQIVAQQKAYMDNLYRLGGGPLANTEAGERFRRNEEMARRIGGRTGAAVPPQYRR